VQHATHAGLLRAYRTEHEQLVGVRGRIDIAAQIRQPGSSRIACTFDEYTVDVIENRVLKAACRRLLQVPGVQFEVRRVLRQALVAFEDVADGPVRAEAIDWIVFNRLNRHYEPALRLAQLVLRNLSLLDQAGQHGASAFLVDMNDLFQRYVTDRLARSLRGRLEVVPEPPVRLGTKGRIPMKPDLVFRRRGADVFVGDLKYKLAEAGQGRSGDYYQLLAYLTAMNLQRGVLIYCQTTGEAPQRRVDVVHSDKQLLTYAVDMTGSRPQLEAAIDDLATWIVSETRAAGVSRQMLLGDAHGH
jgi:5-methylcytosine-specific restriction enzyme subunit McrC